MSLSKRPTKRQAADSQSASPLPASKRLKSSTSAHVPQRTGLDFLIDDNARAGKKLDAKLTNGVPKNKSLRVDESHTVVAPDTAADEETQTQHPDVIQISSDEESSDDDSIDSGEAERFLAQAQADRTTNGLANGHSPHPVGEEREEDAVPGAADALAETNGVEPQEEAGDDEEPTFGDMLQARHPGAIDVHGSLQESGSGHLIPTNGNHAPAAPSATSLGTVLTQALRTKDSELLESCFQMTNLDSIRATIQRLQSQHISTLLERIAERIHRRPGRAGNLMVWIQWSLVSHGGYLASQPDVMRKIKILVRVIRERANGLQPLLHLKGKLEMLSAQLEIRRNLQAASRMANGDDSDDEEGVLYVEGQKEDWSDGDEMADDEPVAGSAAKTSKRKLPRIKDRLRDAPSSGDEDEEEMPNGTIGEDDDEDFDDEDADGMLDIEAEEASDNDEASSADEEESDVPSEEDVEEDETESEEQGVKAPRPSTLNRKR